MCVHLSPSCVPGVEAFVIFDLFIANNHSSALLRINELPLEKCHIITLPANILASVGLLNRKTLKHTGSVVAVRHVVP
jgi:hypothetical protein